MSSTRTLVLLLLAAVSVVLSNNLKQQDQSPNSVDFLSKVTPDDIQRYLEYRRRRSLKDDDDDHPEISTMSETEAQAFNQALDDKLPAEPLSVSVSFDECETFPITGLGVLAEFFPNKCLKIPLTPGWNVPGVSTPVTYIMHDCGGDNSIRGYYAAGCTEPAGGVELKNACVADPGFVVPSWKALCCAPDQPSRFDVCPSSTSQPTAAPIARVCAPQDGMDVDQCTETKTHCGSFGVGMKWTGRGSTIRVRKPRGGCTNQRARDGGCQCEDYCGYQALGTCNADPLCQWQLTGGRYRTGCMKGQQKGACFYKSGPMQGQKGFPMPQCTQNR